MDGFIIELRQQRRFDEACLNVSSRHLRLLGHENARRMMLW